MKRLLGVDGKSLIDSSVDFEFIEAIMCIAVDIQHIDSYRSCANRIQGKFIPMLSNFTPAHCEILFEIKNNNQLSGT